MPKQEKEKTAILINSPEVLFLSHKDLANIYVVVFKNSPLAHLAKKNFSASRLIYIKQKSQSEINEAPSVEFGDLISKTDLTVKLLKYQIKNFLIPYRSSKKIELWAKKYNFCLLVTPLATQDKLEDKKYFDNFLKKNQITSPCTLSLKDFKKLAANNLPYVVQEAKLSDYFRTKFYLTGRQLFVDWQKNKLKLDKVVAREYLEGLPVGVSIFLDQTGNYFFSALRTQCFYYGRNGFPKSFMGLQWLPRKFFNPKTLLNINFQLKKLTQALIKEKFFGVANVDFIIKNNRAFILECNPRLSVATPQVFSSFKLASYSKSWLFFLNTFTYKLNANICRPCLPQSSFSGAVLALEAEKPLRLVKIPPVGTYQIKENKVKFISHKIVDLRQSGAFFLYHELFLGQSLKKGYDLCKVFSNLPLFDFKTGMLNKNGRTIFDYFNDYFYAHKN
ncbi:MAG: ATP-grasp domain-containing protein [Patescibacteria group bacterium]|jgi:hypothetical protein